MSKKAAAVFAVPELLERVLLELSPLELVLAQRVNKTFKDTIKQSPYIQQKLFFTADPSRDGTSSAVNPFLRCIIKAAEQWECINLSISPNGECEKTYIRDKFHSSLDDPYTVGEGGIVNIDLRGREYRTPLRLSHESWREMLLADPPCKFKIYADIPEFDIYNPRKGKSGVQVPAGFWYYNEFEAGNMVEIIEVLEDLGRHWVKRGGKLAKP